MQQEEIKNYMLNKLNQNGFSFLSTMFLYKKIVKTDMNSSLKILE